MTINFGQTECPPEDVSAAFEKLRDNHFGPWLRRNAPKDRKEGPPTFIWSLENASGYLHAHWLVHIPTDRIQDFIRRLPLWLEKVAGQIASSEAAIHVRAAPTPRGAVKYLIKGIDPMYAPLYGIRQSDQGKVMGNRSNFSRCLGPSVRKRLQEEGSMKPTRRIGLPRKIVPQPSASL